MENTEMWKSKTQAQAQEQSSGEFQELIQTLRQEKSWDGTHICEYQGFWCPLRPLKALLCFQQHFQAEDTDIILCTLPKSGTTWTKALLVSIVGRAHHTPSSSPLLSASPHQLIPFVELDLYWSNPSPDLQSLPSPRIISTHIPYASLPASIPLSACRIVYVCRNPLDQLVSQWHFIAKQRRGGVDPLPFDQVFEMYCKGMNNFGPFWGHVLGYWKASLENPNRVLFMKYEDMKQDIKAHIKKLAHFLGVPFTPREEEEEEGLVDEIGRLCSFQNLKDLEVNNKGKHAFGIPNEVYFRKGEVGDWANYLTPSMAQRLKQIVEDKLSGSGLTFNFS